ncbi:DUF2254 domain-containing protein [Kineococcus rhizosphaerae]|uniref:Putative membrane protein n=1 Tax=Kineococcus rhizosphaerae TaxID=559628 RepID=A0A2T0QWW3_9ACTN|nr:DUF2254 domain-containing protein [Kineococcus rhizosphaerae]PRY10058.1 putative membrane protein [Kineococcus rhizosphaerae]
MSNSSKPRGIRLAALQEAARTRLWPVPVAGVVLALVAGVLLPLLDARVDENLPDPIADLVFGGGAGAARTVLDAVASSLITVTSLTFSLTVVTLQLASSQFSPRLLRTFTQDRFVHATLAVFLATFTYALTVLRTVRSPDDAGSSALPSSAVVPRISVTVAFLLAVASVVCLVLFLAHLAREIRVETMLSRVRADACRTADLLYPSDGTARSLPGAGTVPVPDAAVPLPAGASGFLCFVDEEALLEAATGTGVVVAVERWPGGSVVRGTPLARCWTDDGAAPPVEVLERLEDVLGTAVVIGSEPTQAQDLAFGLRQLVDVASKALSPGVNDPTTAVHAVGHAAAFLCHVADRDLGDQVARDEDGHPRLVVHRPDLPALLDLAVAQPLRYGAADPVVLTRLATLLAEVAWSGPRDVVRSAVQDQLDRLVRTAAGQDLDEIARAQLDDAVRGARDALRPRGGRAWTGG